ncbi:hypothetical protein [Arsenophonus endosymbiont of Aleurodicus dispersus]|uniref:hypothetical protein n=1 Tax=Arsenophonus endosymbiont of Aleurodicus dispersus TaxID=235559 RepID=UPI000EAD3FE3|nr:hypothetical protein [Arsenophonus endosymbiont of Aleurodicus dispersus]
MGYFISALIFRLSFFIACKLAYQIFYFTGSAREVIANQVIAKIITLAEINIRLAQILLLVLLLELYQSLVMVGVISRCC